MENWKKSWKVMEFEKLKRVQKKTLSIVFPPASRLFG